MNTFSAVRIRTPGKQMKKQTTKSFPLLATVKTVSKPALGECALALAATLLGSCEVRGHFNRRPRAAAAVIRATDETSFEPSEFELAVSER
jgi:hypothetical protein